MITGESAGLVSGFMQPRSDAPEDLGAVLVYEGPLSAGSAPSVWVYGSSGTVGSTGGDYAFFDVNGDGVLDLLLSRYWESYIDYEAGLLWRLDGPIESSMTVDDWPSLWDGSPWVNGVDFEDSLAHIEPVADITGDGRPDLLVRGRTIGKPTYLLDRFEPGHQPITDTGRRLSEPNVFRVHGLPDQNGDGSDELVLGISDYRLRDHRLVLFYGDAP